MTYISSSSLSCVHRLWELDGLRRLMEVTLTSNSFQMHRSRKRGLLQWGLSLADQCYTELAEKAVMLLLLLLLLYLHVSYPSLLNTFMHITQSITGSYPEWPPMGTGNDHTGNYMLCTNLLATDFLRSTFLRRLWRHCTTATDTLASRQLPEHPCSQAPAAAGSCRASEA